MIKHKSHEAQRRHSLSRYLLSGLMLHALCMASMLAQPAGTKRVADFDSVDIVRGNLPQPEFFIGYVKLKATMVNVVIDWRDVGGDFDTLTYLLKGRRSVREYAGSRLHSEYVTIADRWVGFLYDRNGRQLLTDSIVSWTDVRRLLPKGSPACKSEQVLLKVAATNVIGHVRTRML